MLKRGGFSYEARYHAERMTVNVDRRDLEQTVSKFGNCGGRGPSRLDLAQLFLPSHSFWPAFGLFIVASHLP